MKVGVAFHTTPKESTLAKVAMAQVEFTLKIAITWPQKQFTN